MSATNTSNTIIDPTLLLTPYQLNIYLGLFIFVTVTRIIQKGFRLPIINRYDVVCKIRQFLSQYTHQVAFTLFTLATIDRFLSTHRSNVFWFLLVGHRLFLYSNISGVCAAHPGFYEKLDIYFEAIMSGVCPPVVLLILGCALLRNVRQVVHRRIQPTGIVSQALAVSPYYIQQIDAQLTNMLLLQSFVAIPSFFPYGAQNLYSNITEDWYKSPLRLAWETVFIELIRLFSYLFYSTSFYVSFYSSRSFRKAVLQVLRIERFQMSTDSANTRAQMISTNVGRKNEHKPA
ncbi:unnamed protein product [Rotaria sp. Silwood1]|nr:unnamed protein product [Rotaria sp. Silwood1]CAF1556593.1 unnamed protein product [Rotaria sp. Silwood1]CAF3620262.1 unnamed protein product [Rotaria sp. Silwood1]CAF4574621.1 unnamed protein product [Rotaria sp. Silwood1]CAF4630987.1 unnamed protein product [Rotaria sp. Silwood1]